MQHAAVQPAFGDKVLRAEQGAGGGLHVGSGGAGGMPGQQRGLTANCVAHPIVSADYASEGRRMAKERLAGSLQCREGSFAGLLRGGLIDHDAGISAGPVQRHTASARRTRRSGWWALRWPAPAACRPRRTSGGPPDPGRRRGRAGRYRNARPPRAARPACVPGQPDRQPTTRRNRNAQRRCRTRHRRDAASFRPAWRCLRRCRPDRAAVSGPAGCRRWQAPGRRRTAGPACVPWRERGTA